MTNTNLAPDALRAETLSLLESSAARFSDLVQSLSPAEWEAQPLGEEWSIAQVCEHVGLVEVGSGKLIARKMFEAPATAEMLAEARDKTRLIKKMMPDRAGTARKAPDFVTPTGKWRTRDELLSDFWQWRGSTIAILSDPARDPSKYAATHPVWGMLDATAWGLFLSLHLERHLEQIAEKRAGQGPAPTPR
jgi:hypothetical protein